MPVGGGRLVACPKRSSLDFFLVGLLVVDLLGGCFARLAVRATASICDVGEGSHDHDRDDHSATKEGNVRMTVHKR